MSDVKKRTPVRTKRVDEDDTLRLAHLLRSIQSRCGEGWARALVVRAFAFNGQAVIVQRGKVVPE